MVSFALNLPATHRLTLVKRRVVGLRVSPWVLELDDVAGCGVCDGVGEFPFLPERLLVESERNDLGDLRVDV